MRYRVLVEYRDVFQSVCRDSNGEWYIINDEEGDEWTASELHEVMSAITENLVPYDPAGDIVIRPVV